MVKQCHHIKFKVVGTDLQVDPPETEAWQGDDVTFIAFNGDLEIKDLGNVFGEDPIRVDHDARTLVVLSTVNDGDQFPYKAKDLDTGATPNNTGPPTVRIKRRS